MNQDGCNLLNVYRLERDITIQAMFYIKEPMSIELRTLMSGQRCEFANGHVTVDDS